MVWSVTGSKRASAKSAILTAASASSSTLSAVVTRKGQPSGLASSAPATAALTEFPPASTPIRASVAILIAEAEHSSAIGLATEGAVSVAGNVEISCWRGGDVDGIIGGRSGGEQRHVELIGNADIFQNRGFLSGSEFHDHWLDIAGVGERIFLVVARLSPKISEACKLSREQEDGK